MNIEPSHQELEKLSQQYYKTTSHFIDLIENYKEENLSRIDSLLTAGLPHTPAQAFGEEVYAKFSDVINAYILEASQYMDSLPSLCARAFFPFQNTKQLDNGLFTLLINRFRQRDEIPSSKIYRDFCLAASTNILQACELIKKHHGPQEHDWSADMLMGIVYNQEDQWFDEVFSFYKTLISQKGKQQAACSLMTDPLGWESINQYYSLNLRSWSKVLDEYFDVHVHYLHGQHDTTANNQVDLSKEFLSQLTIQCHEKFSEEHPMLTAMLHIIKQKYRALGYLDDWPEETNDLNLMLLDLNYHYYKHCPNDNKIFVHHLVVKPLHVLLNSMELSQLARFLKDIHFDFSRFAQARDFFRLHLELSQGDDNQGRKGKI